MKLCPDCKHELERGRCNNCGWKQATSSSERSIHTAQCLYRIGTRQCQMRATMFELGQKTGYCEWHKVYLGDPRMAQDPRVFIEYWNSLDVDYPNHPWLLLDRQEAWDRLMGYPAFGGKKGFTSLTVLPAASSTALPTQKAPAQTEGRDFRRAAAGDLGSVLDSADDDGVEVDEGENQV